ncbi:MAG: RNA methyltransferase [Anaerolineales bacterium]
MITSSANPRVKWVRGLQDKRKERHDEQLFVAEGIRWADEIVAAGAKASAIFHTEHMNNARRALVNQLASAGAEVIPVSDSVMAAMSDTESAQDLLIVAPFPQPAIPAQPTAIVVADQLSDPGNLGGLLRTCLAADVDLVLLTHGSVDPFNPKVVRAAMGALLHLPIQLADPADLPDRLAGLICWLAEADQGIPYTEVNWQQPFALLIGSEAHGASPAVRALADDLTHVPISASSDSLNAAVAAAVILFETRRQRGNV